MSTEKAPQLGFLSLIALSPTLSPAAAEVIYEQVPAARVPLAENPHVAAALRAQLVSDHHAMVRAAALAHCHDVDVLTRAALSGSGRERQAVAANPATDVDTLTALAATGEASVVRWLLTNPSLPSAAAEKLAGTFSVGHLWSSGRPAGSSQGSAVWRSAGVAATLAAHPEVARCWVHDPEPTVARVIAYSPTVDEPTVADIVKYRRSRVTSLALGGNPFVPEETLGSLTDTARRERRRLAEAVAGDDLAQLASAAAADPSAHEAFAAVGSRTLDWLLADSSVLTEDTAITVALRVGGQTVEPWVMARLTNRFGGRVAAALLDKQSISRCRPASQWSPLLRVLTTNETRTGLTVDPVAAADLAASLATEIGEDRDAWQVAISLLASAGPELTAHDLATVALGVSST